MSKPHSLQFHCQNCQNPVIFSIFDLEAKNSLIQCSHCHKKYAFQDENLCRQLRKFEALCRQLIESEEILSHASIGVDVNGRQVKIPYKILLTRLNSTLDLMIGDQPFSITFRIEPLKDLGNTNEK